MRFYIVDVFAEEKYAGNQLAVIHGAPDDATMQALAREMNYSETTFITATRPDGSYDVRIFTPETEFEFAGHPTLGTAYVIAHELQETPAQTLILNEGVGPIPVTFAADGVLWMQQNPPQFGHVYDPAQVAAALGLTPDDIDTGYPVQEVSTGLPFIIAPLRTRAAVQRAAVNLSLFKAMIADGHDKLAANAILVFCAEPLSPENDLHARCFVHLHGIPEDPATGSANGNLAGWLARYRYLGEDTVNVRVEQGYAIKRPSLLYLQAQVAADDRITVRVGGRVQMIARGDLLD